MSAHLVDGIKDNNLHTPNFFFIIKIISHMNTKKLNDILGSRNFFVSLISLVILIFQMNGSPIDDVDATSGQIYDALKEGGIIPILSIIVPNLLNPIMKIIKGGFDISFLKSLNFWVQFGTVVLIALGGFGVVFPDGTAAQIVEAVFAGDWGLLVTVIIANVFNPLWHIFLEKRNAKPSLEMAGR